MVKFSKDQVKEYGQWARRVLADMDIRKRINYADQRFIETILQKGIYMLYIMICGYK